jgi:L-fucose mutarotase
MLKGIATNISPDLLKVLYEMGHGDRIVFADANFPVESCGRNCKVIRCDGHDIPSLLDGILKLFPLDTFVAKPVALMDNNSSQKPLIWSTYEKQIASVDNRGNEAIECIERFKYYEEAQNAYAIVATGEMALYASIILQKGIITE